MLENIDIETIRDSQKFFSLKDYKNDGTLSYCDISLFKDIIDLTNVVIDKTIRAREKKNWRVLNKIAQYEDDSIVRSSAVSFYRIRDLYSKAFYFVTQMKNQQIYHIPDVSIIPPGIRIDNDLETKNLDIKEFLSGNSEDLDMFVDKLFAVFYKYFHIGQIFLNDLEILTYTYTLMSSTADPGDKVFYDFVKNSAYLCSVFILFDRLKQLKEALDLYDRTEAFYLSKMGKSNNVQWLIEPRLSNMKELKSFIREGLSSMSDCHRLIMLMNRHIAYIDTVKGLDPDFVIGG